MVVMVGVVGVGVAVGGLLLLLPLLLLLFDCFSAFWSMRLRMSVLRRGASWPLRMDEDDAAAASAENDDSDNKEETAMHTMVRAKDDDDHFMVCYCRAVVVCSN